MIQRGIPPRGRRPGDREARPAERRCVRRAGEGEGYATSSTPRACSTRCWGSVRAARSCRGCTSCRRATSSRGPRTGSRISGRPAVRRWTASTARVSWRRSSRRSRAATVDAVLGHPLRGLSDCRCAGPHQEFDRWLRYGGRHHRHPGPGGGTRRGELRGIPELGIPAARVESGGAIGDAPAGRGTNLGQLRQPLRLADRRERILRAVTGRRTADRPAVALSFVQRKIKDLISGALSPIRAGAPAGGDPPPEWRKIPPAAIDLTEDKISGAMVARARISGTWKVMGVDAGEGDRGRGAEHQPVRYGRYRERQGHHVEGHDRARACPNLEQNCVVRGAGGCAAVDLDVSRRRRRRSYAIGSRRCWSGMR